MIGASDREDRSLMLHAGLDGELDAAGMIEMERALAADRNLAAEYARLEALRQAIRAQAPRETAPEALRARVIAAAASHEAAARRPTLDILITKRPSWRTFAAAIAATIVVTVGVQNLISTAGSPDEVTLAVVAGHMLQLEATSQSALAAVIGSGRSAIREMAMMSVL